MDRLPLFLDTATGLITQTSSTNTIDLATIPWLEAALLDLARCKAALRSLDIEPDLFEPDLSQLLGA
jgi:hypothetical protein